MSFVSYLKYCSQLPPRAAYRYCSHVTDEEERLTHPVVVEGGGWVDRKKVRLQSIASDGLRAGAVLLVQTDGT